MDRKKIKGPNTYLLSRYRKITSVRNFLSISIIFILISTISFFLTGKYSSTGEYVQKSNLWIIFMLFGAFPYFFFLLEKTLAYYYMKYSYDILSKMTYKEGLFVGLVDGLKIEISLLSSITSTEDLFLKQISVSIFSDHCNEVKKRIKTDFWVCKYWKNPDCLEFQMSFYWPYVSNKDFNTYFHSLLNDFRMIEDSINVTR